MEKSLHTTEKQSLNLRENIPLLITFTLLLLHLTNMLNQEIPFGYLFIASSVFFHGKDLRDILDKEALWIFLFSFIYTAFNALGKNSGVQYLIIQVVFPVIFYMMGKFAMKNIPSNAGRINFLILIGLAYAFTPLISIIQALASEGFVASQREVKSIWTGAFMKSTGTAAKLIYVLTIPGILIAAKKVLKPRMTLIWLGLFAITLVASFRTGSRTCLAIAGISLAIGIALYLISQNLIGKIRTIIVIGLSLFVITKSGIIDLESDIFSVLGARLLEENTSSVSTAGNRTQLWSHAIEQLTENPLGWTSAEYAHNTWLDIAHVGGVLSLVLFIIINIFCFRSLYRLSNFDGNGLAITLLGWLFIVSSFMIFFGEPIVLGNFFAITIYLFYQGSFKEISLK